MPKKTVEAYREEKAEKLILLGDILYHGPRNDFAERLTHLKKVMNF